MARRSLSTATAASTASPAAGSVTVACAATVFSAAFLAATFLATNLLATPAHAHHSWPAIYKTDERITIEGVVTEFLFRSPHLALMVDVENEAGEIEQWMVEWSSPRRHVNAGHARDTFRPGDEVTVTGQPAWTPGRKSVRLRSLTRASDGFTLSFGRGPQPR